MTVKLVSIVKKAYRLLINLKYRLAKTSAIAMLSLWLCACTSSLVVESDFPQPVTDPIAINLGIIYKPEFKNYEYREQSKSRTRWIVEMGKAHKNLFEQVFSTLVKNKVQIKDLDNATGANVDLVLLPEIVEFQYSSPRETKVNIYEVWIKYHMQIYNPQGDLVADWIMSAYGKTPSAFLKSNEEAMNQAVMVALRDLGASLTTGLSKVPEIRAWLDDNTLSNNANESVSLSVISSMEIQG